jgi:subtilase family serine protease
MAAILALIFLSAAAVPAAEQQTLRGHVPAAVAGLQALGPLPATNRLHLVIGLQLHNRGALTDLLQQLYDPASTNFHQYLTPAQFTARFGPTEADYQTVLEFANTNGFEITRISGDRVLVDVSATVSDIERAFRVALGRYQHPTEHREFYAPDVEPSVETNVPILSISGLNNYFTGHPMAGIRQRKDGTFASPGGSGTGGLFQGSDFRNAYAPGVKLTGSGQMVGLVEEEGYYYSDITAYESLTGLPTVPIQNVPLDSFSLNSSDTNGILECSLDIEMVISMAPGLTKLYVFEDTFGNTDHILQSMVASNQIKQFSSSWAMSQDSTAETYLLQMAGQGQSFFMASGDGLAYVASCGAIPWPSDDHYVTSVGGSELVMTNKGAAYVSESVWNSGYQPFSGPWSANCMSSYWGSGGGVSTSFSIPGWQKGVNMAAVGGSTTQRNIPDVALTGDKVWVLYNNGSGTPVFGTSIAAPLWAGFLALVNQQIVGDGKPPVGFLNPALYAIGEGSSYNSAFNDITVGNNFWPSSPSLFSAAVGYDLCTGWGTPNGAGMINALEGYAGPIYVDFNYTGGTQDGSYNAPFKTLAGGTNAVAAHGTIIVRTAGSSSETMTIAKPMTITAIGGAATIGH